MTRRTKSSGKQGLIVLSNRLPYDLPREPDDPPPKTPSSPFVPLVDYVFVAREGNAIDLGEGVASTVTFARRLETAVSNAVDTVRLRNDGFYLIELGLDK